MKALLLAGGYGTRLRPLTETRPKHLLPIANRPHVYRVLDLLGRHGVDEIVLATSYLAEAFDEVVHTGRQNGLTVHVAHEEEPLGTAGAIRNAARMLDDSPFLVFNADVLTAADIGSLVAFHHAHPGLVTMLVVTVPDPSRYGVVVSEEGGRVTAFIEKPPADAAPSDEINAGVYVMDPGVIDYIPKDQVSSAEHDLFPELVGRQALYAGPTERYWIDIGTRESYLTANTDALAQAGVENVIADDARIDPEARLSSACIGPGAVVEEGAVIERSVTLPRVFVGKGATVRDSVLGEGSVVGPGRLVVEDSLRDGAEARWAMELEENDD